MRQQRRQIIAVTDLIGGALRPDAVLCHDVNWASNP
jgi:hypothetical protein